MCYNKIRMLEKEGSMSDNRTLLDETERELRKWAIVLANQVQPYDNGTLSAEGKLKNVLAAAVEIEKFVTH